MALGQQAEEFGGHGQLRRRMHREPTTAWQLNGQSCTAARETGYDPGKAEGG